MLFVAAARLQTDCSLARMSPDGSMRTERRVLSTDNSFAVPKYVSGVFNVQMANCSIFFALQNSSPYPNFLATRHRNLVDALARVDLVDEALVGPLLP